jgi:RNA polymerase sigma-70 factor (ECF subfamily)
MAADSSFRRLIQRVRDGDAQAAAELLRQYEAELRRLVRVRLSDPRLRRTLDSMDICQSVLAQFFVRAAAGQFELNDPHDLMKLLVVMAKNKVLEKVRYLHARVRDVRREDAAGGEALRDAASAEGPPGEALANRELLDEVRRRLTPEERHLAEQRSQGRPWAELAAELGKTADALRKQHDRGIDRVVRELGLA